VQRGVPGRGLVGSVSEKGWEVMESVAFWVLAVCAYGLYLLWGW